MLFKKQQKKPCLLFNKDEFSTAATVQIKVTHCWKASLLIKWATATHKDLPIIVCLPSIHFLAWNETNEPSLQLSNKPF